MEEHTTNTLTLSQRWLVQDLLIVNSSQRLNAGKGEKFQLDGIGVRLNRLHLPLEGEVATKWRVGVILGVCGSHPTPHLWSDYRGRVACPVPSSGPPQGEGALLTQPPLHIPPAEGRCR